jgi:hypothetical protein
MDMRTVLEGSVVVEQPIEINERQSTVSYPPHP